MRWIGKSIEEFDLVLWSWVSFFFLGLVLLFVVYVGIELGGF